MDVGVLREYLSLHGRRIPLSSRECWSSTEASLAVDRQISDAPQTTFRRMCYYRENSAERFQFIST